MTCRRLHKDSLIKWLPNQLIREIQPLQVKAYLWKLSPWVSTKALQFINDQLCRHPLLTTTFVMRQNHYETNPFSSKMITIIEAFLEQAKRQASQSQKKSHPPPHRGTITFQGEHEATSDIRTTHTPSSIHALINTGTDVHRSIMYETPSKNVSQGTSWSNQPSFSPLNMWRI